MSKKTKLSFDEKPGQYKVRDLSLHEFGRKEIDLAHTEMPGLMSLLEEFGESMPLRNARVAGSLHMTIQTAVLIETLHSLGANVRWSSCNIFSTQDHAAAAIAKSGNSAVFAWKGESIEEYWDCLYQTMVWPDGKGPDLIVDDGGDATLLLHEGVKAEKSYKATGKLPEIPLKAHEEKQSMMRVLIRSLQEDPTRWHKMVAVLKGVSEETTTGVARLKQLADRNELLFPAFNVNDSVTKSKFDNVYGCKHSLPDGIKRATDILLSGKKVVICGFGDVGKGCAAAMKAEGARVTVTEIDPICALQAVMEGFEVDTLDRVCSEVDVVVTSTGNKNVVTGDHLRRMRDNAVVCNIGHFDNEIDVDSLLKDKSVQRQCIKPQVDRFQFSDGRGVIILAEGRLVNLSCATGHPSMVMSTSFTNQVLAVLQLWTDTTRKWERKVYRLPRELDEKVARLHLGRFGARLTKLTREQSEYVGLKVEGPFKTDEYRY